MSLHPFAADGYPVGPALRRALMLLIKAKSLAADVGHDIWDFAVEINRLQDEGLTACDLRWLTCRGLVAHAREADPLSPRRWFTGPGGLNFPPGTCFILTELGMAFATEYYRPSEPSHPPVSPSSAGEGAGVMPIVIEPSIAHARNMATKSSAMEVLPNRPIWDADRRELSVGGRLVKRYRVPAPIQELILSAFEEDGWPTRVDDPLPFSQDLEPKRRLQTAILSLNRNQRAAAIRFHGDGNGTGIRWEPI